MDTLKIIKEKVELLSSIAPQDGLLAVVKHLKVAESHYFHAQKLNDDDLYTDVIYRTNHAFEGILKEAYALLAERDSRNQSPYQIEQYLSQNQVFNPRVTELFVQYRTQWRNQSTHEYQLTFTQQESFLAILSVTSFVSILLDQMITKAAFNSETSIEETEVVDSKEVEKLQTMPILDQISYLLPSFYRQMQIRSSKSPIKSGVEIEGRLHAFLQSSFPELKIEYEPTVFYEDKRYVPDFVLTHGNERIVLELKMRYANLPHPGKDLEHMMLRYVLAAEASAGIVFVYPTKSQKDQKFDHVEVTVPDNKHIIVYVSPRTGKKRHLASNM